MASQPDAAREAYDPARNPGKVSPLAAWLANPPRWLLWFLRTFIPILRLPFFNFAGVFRYDHVAEVLTQYKVFQVPFGEEIARLNDGVPPGEKGTPFILGMDDEAEHAAQLREVAKAFARSDAGEVARISWDFASGAIAGAVEGPMDAIPQLITAVPLEVCRQYYGVDIPDGQRFAYATIDVSGHLFGPPPIRPKEDIDVAADLGRDIEHLSAIVVTHEHDEDLLVALRDAFDAARRKLEDYARSQRGDVKRHSLPRAQSA